MGTIKHKRTIVFVCYDYHRVMRNIIQTINAMDLLINIINS